MGIVHKDVALFYAVFAYFYHLQAKSLLHETPFFVRAEQHRLAVFQIDGVHFAPFTGVDGCIATIVENHAVL